MALSNTTLAISARDGLDVSITIIAMPAILPGKSTSIRSCRRNSFYLAVDDPRLHDRRLRC